MSCFSVARRILYESIFFWRPQAKASHLKFFFWKGHLWFSWNGYEIYHTVIFFVAAQWDKTNALVRNLTDDRVYGLNNEVQWGKLEEFRFFSVSRNHFVLLNFTIDVRIILMHPLILLQLLIIGLGSKEAHRFPLKRATHKHETAIATLL